MGSALTLNAQEASSNAAKPEAAKAPEKSGARKGREWGTAPAPEFAPERVMLGWIGDPAHTQAITWRTEKLAQTPQIEFALASADPSFIKSAASVPAKSGSLDLGNGKTVATYRANIEGLKPNTHYLYRAGDGINWNEWNGFHTANDQPTKFRFLYVGDAQNDIRSRWSRLIESAYSKAPKSAFIINGGDLVAEGYRDDLWGEWYDSMGFIAANIPLLSVPGNHETEKPKGEPKSLSLPAIWAQQFSYPQNGPGLPDNESFYLDYQGVRFISLNVNMMEYQKDFETVRPMAEKEAAWLERVLKENPNHWTVLFQHQGMYSMASNRNYVEMREVLLPLYDKYGVDLVLQGHDHLYARSQKLAGGKIVAPDAPGTVYVISVSGPKMYEIDHRFEPLMAKVIPNTQMFQVIEVDGKKMTLRAYSSEGELLDGFQLEKKNGLSVLSEPSKPTEAPSAPAMK